jgi:hypothetical protein
MSGRIRALTEEVQSLASAMSRVRSTPAKVEIIPRPPTDRALAARRNRLEDPREIAALKRRLGLSR